ncbi:MAG: glutamine-hydrolyzing carbamoyl-phosphate synthase small subunit [Acidimicrobiia bacterium]|nr:MAG: glutamine-hydrolyzing carbamoyl-phosphate synthase small subunit [Acidimicrobiia bacterium]
MKQGLLVTAHGEVFRGRSVGVEGIATGEVVFNTAMSGYQEIITDPSYSGQVVVLTAPHIGNYGSAHYDNQSPMVHARSLVMRSMSRVASSWRSTQPFGEYLVQKGVVALSDIDTRRLTRHVRERGAMPVAVGVDTDEADIAAIAASTPSMQGQDLASAVSTPESYRRDTDGPKIGHVVAYDFGIKTDIIRSLNARGLDVTVVPASTSAVEVLSLGPDAVFLSNGPGDPEPLAGPVEAIRGLLGKTPVFGICLGHQLLGLALGAEIFKLPFGHHGGNHPVRRLSNGSVEITSQNHGFAVDLSSMAGGERQRYDGLETRDTIPEYVPTPFGEVSATHQNLNDGTNEGIACHDVSAFSVQYHPEAAPGPNDASHLFDRFIDVVKGSRAETN